MTRLRQRQEWKFFGVLWRASPGMALAWWIVLVIRGLVPVLFAVAMGVLVGAVNDGSSLTGPLIFVGVVFVAFQVLTPIHQALSSNLGSRAADLLLDDAGRELQGESLGHLLTQCPFTDLSPLLRLLHRDPLLHSGAKVFEGFKVTELGGQSVVDLWKVLLFDATDLHLEVARRRRRHWIIALLGWRRWILAREGHRGALRLLRHR